MHLETNCRCTLPLADRGKSQRFFYEVSTHESIVRCLIGMRNLQGPFFALILRFYLTHWFDGKQLALHESSDQHVHVKEEPLN